MSGVIGVPASLYILFQRTTGKIASGRTRITSACLAFAAFVILCVLGAECRAQQKSVPADSDDAANIRWHLGYELFQMLLEERGLSTIRLLEEAFPAPNSTVIVILGDLNHLSSADWLRLRHFAVRGGAVLVATDQNYSRGRFHSGPVKSNEQAEHYQGFPDCVIVRDLESDHPLTTGISEIIVNGAGWLSQPSDNAMEWTVVARLPRQCVPSASSAEPLLISGQSLIVDTGTFVMASDPGLFTNNMLWHGDNAALLVRLSDQLCRGSRRRLLFISDGASLGSYRDSAFMADAENPPQVPPLPEDLPEPELKKMLQLANSVISEVEDSNILNETLKNQPRRVHLPSYMRIVLLIIAICAAMILIWNLSRKSVVTPAPRSDRVMQTALSMTSRKSAVTSEFAAAAEVLAADLCRELTGSSLPSEWQKQLSDRSSMEAGSDGSGESRIFWSRKERKGLAMVLEIAVNGRKSHFSRRRFRSIGRTIQSLRTRYRELTDLTKRMPIRP